MGEYAQLMIDGELATPENPTPKVSCPTCHKRVKAAGLADHQRDAHGSGPVSTKPVILTEKGACVEVKCQCCKTPFLARVADRNRGWGKFCSKSCKAIRQTQKTGRGAPSGPNRGPGSARSEGHYGDYADYLGSVHPFSSEAFL